MSIIAHLRLLPVVLTLCLLIPSSGRSEAPYLDLELGQHQTDIAHLAVDEAGRLMVTSDARGELRVWDLLNGALLRTVRFSKSRHVQVRGVAFLAQGHHIAALLKQDDKDSRSTTQFIWFDRRNRQLAGRIVLDGATSMAVWPDGGRVAFCQENGGIRLFQLPSGTAQGEDVGAGSPCRTVGIDSQGRLTVWFADGTLRIYGPSLNRLRSTRLSMDLSEQRAVQAVQVAPDGTRIAVSYRGSARVDLYSGEDLTLLGQATRPSDADEEIEQLGWSRSSHMLCAVTTNRSSGQRQWLHWPQGGSGAAITQILGHKATTALAMLPQDGVVLATAGAAWQVIGANGKALVHRDSERSTILPGSLRIAAGGNRVLFAMYPRSAHNTESRLYQYSIPDRALTPVEATDISRSASDEAVVTESTALRELAARSGIQRAVASADGKTLLSLTSDGTLTVWTGTGDTPLLSLFVHPDGRRWVAWTPAGYYDADAAGEDLLGWVVPSAAGTDRPADFVRLGLLRQHLHRPDIVASALSPPGPASLSIRTVLPPIVDILDPQGHTSARETTLTLRVAVRSISGEPITSVRTLVQGRDAQVRDVLIERPVSTIPSTTPEGEDQARVIQVTLPKDNCTIAVIAETRHSKSEPALLPIRWQGERATSTKTKSNLYVLAVGTSQYFHARLALGYPAKDARDLAMALKQQQHKSFQQVETRVLTDGEATRDNILSGLAWLRQQTTASDVAVFFLAGHGINDPSSGHYYYLPVEADPDRPAATMLDSSQIQSFLATIRGKVMLFLDTCHAGNVLAAQRDPQRNSAARLLVELSSIDSGVVVFAAATSGQVSQESVRWNNGAFTKAVVEGLQGRAHAGKAGDITVSSLENYISERVRELTNNEQTPTTAKPTTVPDFVISSVPVPLYRKAWFWGVMVGGLAVLAATATGLGVALTQEPTLPGGTYPVIFNVNY